MRSNSGIVWLWVVTLVFGVAYLPKTGEWLLGWDNLVPEFDFLLNISRQLNSVWQGYRGLGGVDGMAQAADLSRTLFLWVLSLVVPTNFLRYTWFVLMLGVGMSGVCFLLRMLTRKRFDWKAGVVAGLFYGFNLTTIQMMYVPFEPFVSFFGFLPWLLWGASLLYEKFNWKSVKIFGLITLLSASSFVVQTIFLVYGVMLGLVGIFKLIELPRKNIKPFLVSIFITIALHLYWLTPVGYYAIFHASDAVDSRANQLSTPESIEMNKARGGLRNVVTFNSYLLDYTDQFEEEVDYLMKPWIDHLNRPAVGLMWYGFAGTSLMGLLWLVVSKKIVWPIGLYGLVVVMLSGEVGVFGWIYEWMVKNIPYFGQLFRVAFTKWSLPLGLMSSLGVGSVIVFSKKKMRGLLVGILLLMLVIGSWPVFSKEYIYKKEYVKLPESYIQLFDYMNDQSNGRVLVLPLQHVWGWNQYSFGYGGSGFLWHGIKQPVMDRAFDVWNPYNEKAYFKLSNALYLEDIVEFEKLLSEYRISYVIVDENVSASDENKKVLFFNESKEFLEKSEQIEKLVEFESISVYGRNLIDTFDGEEVVWRPFEEVGFDSQSIEMTDKMMSFSDEVVFDGKLEVKDYVENIPATLHAQDMGGEIRLEINYGLPGVYIAGEMKLEEKIIKKSMLIPYEINPDYVFFGNKYYKLSEDGEKHLLGYLPISVLEKTSVKLAVSDEVLDGDVYTRLVGSGEMSLGEGYGEMSVLVSGGDLLEVVMPVLGDGFSSLPQRGESYNCDSLSRGEVVKEKRGGGYVYVASDGGVGCDYILYDDRSGFDGYVVVGRVRHDGGRGFRFYVHNQENGRTEFEQIVRDDFYYIFSSSNLSGDLVLSYDVKSYGESQVSGVLEMVDVVPVNLSWLESVGEYLYLRDEVWVEDRVIDVSNWKKDVALVVSESYERGWQGFLMEGRVGWVKTYFPWFFGTELEHVKVNGWANGFIVPEGDGEEKTVVIVYWPQYLEWFGLGLLIVTPLGLVIIKRKRGRSLN